MSRSKHIISNPENYTNALLSTFNQAYGDPSQYLIIALVPHPKDAPHSSLAFMLDKLIEKALPDSGFYLNDFSGAVSLIRDFKPKPNQKIFLWGITWALLDFAEKISSSPSTKNGDPKLLDSLPPNIFRHLIVLETGGMKGRREEMVREELHNRLKKAFGVASIHSEYGMTELCSQAYSDGIRGFKTPPWMKILIRDIHDPLTYLEPGRTGGINIIDLANQDSCSFIATQDLGRLNADGSFEVLGRFDDSDLRGCSLML
jgi:hypothetical protein